MNETKLNICKMELDKINETLSEIKGKRTYEISPSQIHQLYDYSNRYASLLEGFIEIKSKKIDEEE